MPTTISGLVLMAKSSAGRSHLHLSTGAPRGRSPTRFNLVRAYLQAGRTAEGLKLGTRAFNSEARDNVQLHFTLGVLLAPRKAVPGRPNSNWKRPAPCSRKHSRFSSTWDRPIFSSGDYEKAEVILNRALKLKPDSPDTLYLLAQVYSEQTRAVDALDLLARAHKLAPENTDVIFLLARVSMTQNYFEDAIPLLESGLKIAPKRADLHAALGESYFMSGKAEKAIEEFKVSDRTGSLGALLCLYGSLLPAPGTL